MRRKLRGRRLKSQKQLVIVGALSLFLVLTVGYAAFSTTVSLTAKGNIIKILKASEYLIENASSCNNDGELVEDPTEPGRYIYRGANPCNYLTLGSDEYRIISIETDGTLKVIKTDSIGNMPWDPGYSSEISGITTASSNVGTRYQGKSGNNVDYCISMDSVSGNGYNGCKPWGSSDTMRNSSGTLLKDTIEGAKMPRIAGNATTYNLPADESYLNVYLNGGIYQGIRVIGWVDSLSYNTLIETHSFDVGPVAYTTNQTLATDISQAHAYTWQGKVGLMTVIDYVKANTNTSLCGTVYLNTSGAGNYTTCKTTNWLFKALDQWMMSSSSTSNSFNVCYANSRGAVSGAYARNGLTTRPVFYLSSDIKLEGNGTSASDAYTIRS